MNHTHVHRSVDQSENLILRECRCGHTIVDRLSDTVVTDQGILSRDVEINRIFSDAE